MSSFALTPTVFVFLGLMAAASTAAVIRRQLDPKGFGLIPIILWIVWGLSAGRVVTVTNSGELVEHTWTPLVFLGFGLAAVMLIDWLSVLFEESNIDVKLR